MRVFIQDDQGRMIASHVDGVTYSHSGSNDEVAFALFKALFGLMGKMPSVAIGEDLRPDDVEGGTP